MADYAAFISRGDVERAVLGLLSEPPEGSTYPLLAYYLARRERIAGLRPRTLPLPPAPESFRGSHDFEAYVQDLCPMVIAVVRPTGRPERKEGATYGQWFDVQVGAVVIAADEDSTRALADEYGAAVMAAMLENGKLNGFAVRTEFAAFPTTQFFDPTKRKLQRAVAGFSTYVEGVVGEWGGPTPLQPLTSDPYAVPGALPTVLPNGPGLTLTAIPADKPLPPQ